MTQLDLLPGVVHVPWNPQHLARTADPITSKEAAAKTKSLAALHHTLILGALMQGAAGVDRLASITKLSPYQVSKRMAELERSGAIRLTGKTVPSDSGRAQREWEKA